MLMYTDLYDVIHAGASDQILLDLYDKSGDLVDLSAVTRGTLLIADQLVDSAVDASLWNFAVQLGRLEILPGADPNVAALTEEWEGFVTLRLYEPAYPSGRTWLSPCTLYRLKVKVCVG